MAGQVEFGGQRLRARTCLDVLVGDHHMNIERRHRGRPAQTQLIVVLFGDHRHQPRNPDAVGTHRQPDGLAVLAENIDGERVGVLAAQLEDVPDLDAAGTHQRACAVR